MFQVSDLNREDAEAIADIHAMSLEEAWSADAIRETIGQDTSICLGIQTGDVWSAFLILLPAVDDVELATIAVHPDARGQGMARFLMMEAMAHARQAGFQRMLLEVAADNDAAISLYQSLGFGVDGTRPGYYSRKHAARVDARLMSINLCV